jgi:hypothetical protein
MAAAHKRGARLLHLGPAVGVPGQRADGYEQRVDVVVSGRAPATPQTTRELQVQNRALCSAVQRPRPVDTSRATPCTHTYMRARARTPTHTLLVYTHARTRTPENEAITPPACQHSTVVRSLYQFRPMCLIMLVANVGA